MKIKAIRPVMVIALLLLLVSPAASQVPDDKLIVPGQRIGKWTLEMTMAELVQMNGPARSNSGSTEDSAPGIWAHNWVPLDLRANTLGVFEQRIASLVALHDVYKTAKGVGPFASQEEVEAAYGKPTAVTTVSAATGLKRWIYDEIGLYFVIGAIVGVFRPGTGKTLWKY